MHKLKVNRVQVNMNLILKPLNPEPKIRFTFQIMFTTAWIPGNYGCALKLHVNNSTPSKST